MYISSSGWRSDFSIGSSDLPICPNIKIGLFLVQIPKEETDSVHLWNFNILGTPFNFGIERIQQKQTKKKPF